MLDLKPFYDSKGTVGHLELQNMHLRQRQLFPTLLFLCVTLRLYIRDWPWALSTLMFVVGINEYGLQSEIQGHKRKYSLKSVYCLALNVFSIPSVQIWKPFCFIICLHSWVSGSHLSFLLASEAIKIICR